MKKLLLLLLGSTLTFGLYAQVALDEGLIVYFPFNGDTEDASGNGNDAVNYGATLTADQAGNPNSAYYFDGVNDYMKIPWVSMFSSLPDSLTFAVKIKPHTFYDGVCHVNQIINTGESDSEPGTYTLHYTSNLYFDGDCYAYDATHQNYRYNYNGTPYNESEVATEPFIEADEWDCVVYTYDGAMHRLYVNGVLRYSTDESAATPGAIVEDIWLGAKDSDLYPYWINATLDEVRIYKRALNEDEIRAYCKSSGQLSLTKNETAASKLPVAGNPVKDVLHISLDQSQLGGDLRISDLSGRTILYIASLTNANVPVARLVSGMYIVSYQLDGKYLKTKIIKE